MCQQDFFIIKLSLCSLCLCVSISFALLFYWFWLWFDAYHTCASRSWRHSQFSLGYSESNCCRNKKSWLTLTKSKCRTCLNLTLTNSLVWATKRWTVVTYYILTSYVRLMRMSCKDGIERLPKTSFLINPERLPIKTLSPKESIQ